MLSNCKPVILLPTVKKEESKHFYESVLGLTFKVDDGFAMVFDTAGITLRITPVKEFTPHAFSVLSWEVGDIGISVRELSARGVEFEKYDFPWMVQDEQRVWTTPDGTKLCWFKDPDGNLLALVQHTK